MVLVPFVYVEKAQNTLGQTQEFLPLLMDIWNSLGSLLKMAKVLEPLM